LLGGVPAGAQEEDPATQPTSQDAATQPEPANLPPTNGEGAGEAEEAQESPDTLAVLPPTVEGGAADQEVGALLASLLATRLAVLGGIPVFSADEVQALLTNEATRQHLGAKDDGLLSELAGNMGARRLVTSHLVRGDAGLTWDVSVVSQTDGQVLQRARAQSGTAQGLVGQVDEVTLQLLGRGREASLTTAAARHRLGLTRQGDLDAFRRYREGHPTLSTQEAFTSFLLDHNLESKRLAMAQAVLLTIPAVAFSGACCLLVTGQYGILYGRPEISLVTVPASLPLVAAGSLAALVASVLSVVDLLDLGRVRVKESGCCRDDSAIAEEEQDNRFRLGTSVWSALSGAGTVMLSVGTLTLAGSVLVVPGILMKPPTGTPRPNPVFLPAALLYNLAFFVLPACCCGTTCVGCASGLTTLVPPRSVVESGSLPALEEDDP
jgi:hypothetical protein